MANVLTGRYMTDYHTPLSLCQLCQADLHSQECPTTSSSNVSLGTLEHQLLDCQSLSTTRENCTLLWRKYCIDKPEVRRIVMLENNGDDHPNTSMQFLLDPSCCPEVICAVQTYGTGILAHVQYLTRTWCYSLHLRRYKILKLLNII